jgi:AAA15 family ATPase/GTPase
MSQSTSAESNGKEPVQGITGISVGGYKSLYEECSIEIRPLTILAGANSSGKSSIMQPLLLMKQTLEATYDPGSLLLNGPNIRFTFTEQFLSYFSDKNRTTKLLIGIDINGQKIKNIFDKDFSKAINITETIYNYGNQRLTIANQMSQDEISSLAQRTLEKHRESKLVDFLINNNEIITDNLEARIQRERCFLNFDCKYKSGFQFILYDTRPYTSLFEHHIRKLIHIPGIRGNPERTYPTTAIGGEFPGTFENYVASVVNHWQNTEDNRLRELESALKALGLTGKVDARQVNDVQIELRVSRLRESEDGSDMVSLADVGIGVSQVLPVLVAILVAEPGQSVYLEQPEIHLHPRAQVAMAQILADAAKRDVRVILETHSELLLLAVQSLVAEGKLSPDLVKLHWFTRREDGVTEVSSAELDEAGAFGDWPEDFGDVSMKLESRYLDAAESRLWKRSHGG